MAFCMVFSLMPAGTFAEELTESGSAEHVKNMSIAESGDAKEGLLSSESPHQHDGEESSWTAISSLDEISGDGSYYLTDNVTSSWSCNYNVKLCLNGKSITGINGQASITVAENASLTLTDCSDGATGKITHVAGESGCGIYNNGTLVLNSGSISGNTVDSYGGGVTNMGSFTMTGGSITGNSSSDGSSFHGGGGVYTNGRFTMTGGLISDNQGNYGGGVYNYANFNMSGSARIEKNNANHGAGVYTDSSWVESKNFTMDGGSISGNTSAKDGGGVSSHWIFNLNGGSISGNTANEGGGVYNGYRFTMNGGTISGNKGSGSVPSGGGVYNYGTFTLANGTIGGSKAADANDATYGGGVYNSKKIIMTGGSITGNTGWMGGGIDNFYISNVSLELKGGSITGNTGGQSGGGICLFSDNSITVSGSIVIKDNNNGNISLPSDSVINVAEEGMASGAKVGISSYKPALGRTVVNSSVDTNAFFSDDSAYCLEPNGQGGLQLGLGEVTISLSLLNKAGGSTMTDGKKVYDGASVAHTEGSWTPNAEGVILTYTWQEKSGEDSYRDLAGTEGPSDVGSYRLLVTATKDGRNVGSAEYPFEITAKDVTASIQVKNKEYDGNTSAEVTTALKGLVAGDEVSAEASNAVFDSKNAGKRTVTADIQLTGKDKDNYKVNATATANGRIKAKKLTVSGLAVADKYYDATNKAEFSGSPSLEGLVSGDEVSLVNGVPSFTSEEIGEDIEVSFTDFSLEGADSTNYKLIQPDGVTASIMAYHSNGSEYRVNSKNWLNTDFIVTAQEGWQLSLSKDADGDWQDKLTVSQECEDGILQFYVRNTESGVISEVISESYKIDKTAPVISGAEEGRSYTGAITLTIKDDHLESVTVNGKDAELTDSKLILNPAEGKQTILAKDQAGNTASLTVTVTEEKSKDPDDQNNDKKSDDQNADGQNKDQKPSDQGNSKDTGKDKTKGDSSGKENAGGNSSTGTTGTKTNTSASTNSKSPKTGDRNDLAFWMALLLMSGAGLTTTGLLSRKKNKRK